MKNIAFILHGKIKERNKITAAIQSCWQGQDLLQTFVTEYASHAVNLAHNAVNAGATHIICVGGDGSLNEVINGVMMAGEQSRNIKIGLLPHGTGNDFARTMHITYNIPLLKKKIDEDSCQLIDLGMAVFFNASGMHATRYFINISDVGIGGAIAMDLANSSKTLGSFITYQKGVLKALATYKNQLLTVRANTFNYNGRVKSLIVANGKFFGGGMGIAPDAVVNDGLFSVVVIGSISTLTYLKNLGNIRKSKRIVHPELQYHHVSEINIESPEGPLPIDMDGEFIGFAPVTYRILPSAISFIA